MVLHNTLLAVSGKHRGSMLASSTQSSEISPANWFVRKIEPSNMEMDEKNGDSKYGTLHGRAASW